MYEVARSCVKGVKIELDGMILAGILGVPGNNEIFEYVKDIWEESIYYKPLPITRKFANDDLITMARRVKSTEIKPFQRSLHFIVIKNVALRFGKRDTTSFMDWAYMDHLLMRRLANLPRVMLRHMAYVISVENHEFPYGDWLSQVFEAYHVPLDDKAGEEPKIYDYFEETFLSMCKLKRENGVWWLQIGENRRRDDEDDGVDNENAPAENLEENPEDFEWEAVNDEVEIQGEEMEKEAEVEESGSGEKYFEERSDEADVQVLDVAAPAPSSFQ
ncbi:hypothetical protein Dimus_002764 [Dionaea muscipula]